MNAEVVCSGMSFGLLDSDFIGSSCVSGGDC